MCGIAGIINHNGWVDPRNIKTMCDIMRHRGPDDEGFVGIDIREKRAHPLVGPESVVSGQRIDECEKKLPFYLGHRRLSILDVSAAGHQPMCDIDGNVWIVYNGEIYNYVELRERLAKTGHTFRTTGDTEVLLHAYLEWGMHCLDKLNGMWAFVIYDMRTNVVWGSRDRFGVKPLYLYSGNGHFAFASEIKALLRLPFVESRINEAVAFGYLAHGICNPEDCFFEGIDEVKPSHAFSLDVSSGKITTWKYFDLQADAPWERFSQARMGDITQHIRELVYNAVRMRLRSDVPVGSCLSGGMDSSSIVCIINELLKKESIQSVGDRQKVFTACYPGKAIDESKWAQIIVDHTATEWYRTLPDAESMFLDLDDVVYHQDIPFVSSSIYAQYRVMRLARENGVKVLLDGQGGDELFTGYPIYYGNFLFDLVRHLAVGLLAGEYRNRHNSSIAGRFLRLLMTGCIKNFLNGLFPGLLRKYYSRQAQLPTPYLNYDFVNRNRQYTHDYSERAVMSLNDMLVYMITRNLPELLRYEDRNSMRFSIESRTPFADDIDLIKYTFSVPSVYKIHNGWNKYLLRQAVDGVVPDAIAARADKVGFETPEYFWLTELKDRLLPLMKSDGIDHFLDYKKMTQDWNSMIQSQQKTSITVTWRYINFALWKKRFKV
jgi:asparagine synthase (glutamine-hydrolysing)